MYNECKAVSRNVEESPYTNYRRYVDKSDKPRQGMYLQLIKQESQCSLGFISSANIKLDHDAYA